MPISGRQKNYSAEDFNFGLKKGVSNGRVEEDNKNNHIKKV